MSRHSRNLIPFTVVRMLLVVSFCISIAAQNIPPKEPDLNIPKVDHPPTLEDFLTMKPSAAWEGKMAKSGQFIQREPKDGTPSSQQTDVYLGYDNTNLYLVFVCFDSQPKTVRARLARRDTINSEDDEVQVYLDTFNDERRAYGFMTNPRGVQYDYLWTESNGYDDSFDTVWKSRGQVTDQGWVAWMAIPFKSLRFPQADLQRWGILLQRVIPRTSETVFWPHVTNSVTGRLNQEGHFTGMEKISPGRNLQFIPFGIMRAFRAPDLRDPSAPRFSSARLRGDIGLDTKVILKDSFVLDVALNPDFSQIESDDPQVTVNQRFEVYFPEKRPFFLENANFFDTPISLLFTRRIADPQLGVRLTGKRGPYALGILFADDQSAGRARPENDPLHGKRAFFGVARVNREFGKSGSLGAMYTHREFEGSNNKVGGIDGTIKFGKEHWNGNFQTVYSNTRFLDKSSAHGTSSQVFIDYTQRKWGFNSLYIDTSPGFRTEAGFFRRPDIRRFSNFIRATFRPKDKRLISHGPSMFTYSLWDYNGLRLENFINVNYRFNFKGSSEIGAFANGGQNRLRPKDFGILTTSQDYRSGRQGVFFYSSYFKQVTVSSEMSTGTEINYVPAAGKPPALADSNLVYFFASVRPMQQLTVDNTYILTNLRDRASGHSIFTNHIMRSKWNYQFTRSLSLRTIFQYTSLLPNSNYTTLSRNKGFNTDFLVAWLLHPGTAVYVGYNTNLQNPDPTFNGIGAPPNRFINDGRQVFIKVSYLFRY